MEEVIYSEKEEKLNIISHGFGAVASFLGSIFLIAKANNLIEDISAVIFGISLITLYAASTLYHSAKGIKRVRLRIFDHSAIFALIAGTYSPVCLVTLNESIGFTLFITIWLIAAAGIILKVFFIGRFKTLSTATYVLMGWIAVFAIKPLLEFMSTQGLIWLAIGGLFYTIGAAIYSRKSIAYNHAIFHVFVLLGSCSHFLMIYFYVL